MKGTVTSKGQLVIPAQMRRGANITTGTRVRFEYIKGGIAIYPQYDDEIDRLKGMLAGWDLPTQVERDPEHER